MARVLVTGGAGFIGSHLVDQLLKAKHRVLVIDDLSVGKRTYVDRRAGFIQARIQESAWLRKIQRSKFDYIFHLAAQKNLQYSKNNPVKDAATNIIGSLNILKYAQKHSIKRFIFFSSAAVYNATAKPPNREDDVVKPITPYGIAKYTIEQYITCSGLPFGIMRPSNVYGPRQDADGEGGVVAIYFKNAVDGKASEINNTGRQTRDFVYVMDVVEAAMLAMSRAKNMTLNLSTNRETTVAKLYAMVYATAGCRRKPRRGKRIDEQYRSALDNNSARRVLHWQPQTSLREGLSETYYWFNKKYGN